MSIGRLLIGAGLCIAIVGVLLVLGERLPIRFGRLPGDILFRGKNTTFYFPIVTCILLSVVLSGLMWLWNRFR